MMHWKLLKQCVFLAVTSILIGSMRLLQRVGNFTPSHSITQEKATNLVGEFLSNNTITTIKKKIHHDKILVLAAGRGTTGTHLMFATTCHLGMPSIHWNLGCIPIDDNLTSHIPLQYQTAKEKHLTLLNSIKMMQRCLTHELKCGSALKWKENMLKLIQQMVLDGQILAFHDNPYPFVMPQFYELAKEHYRAVIIISSERDPEKYTKRRIEQFKGRDDPICLDFSTKIDKQPSAGVVLI